MTTPLLLVLGLLAAAIVMFVINRPRMDAVGLLMLVLLPLTGVLSINEALAGFADSSIVLLAALFVVGEGLVRTGVARRLGDWINGRAGGSETKLLVLLMACTAGLGSLMSSTAVVAFFIPVALRIAQNTGLAPSRLMMPLSVAGLISGMLTLVATAPNLVINAELERQGLPLFQFFSFTPFGLPVLVLGIGYMLLARGLLPERRPAEEISAGRPTLRSWIEEYGLAEREHRVRVTGASALVGRRLEDLKLRENGINLLAIERSRKFQTEMIRPIGRTEIEAGDIMLIDSRLDAARAQELQREFALERLPLSPDSSYFTDRSQEIGLVEVMVPAESPLLGMTVRERAMRTEYALTVIGLRRGSKRFGQDEFLDEPLRVGDTLLLVGFWRDIRRISGATSLVLVLNRPAEFDEVLPAADKAPFALGALALMVVLMVGGVIANVHAALVACLLMGLFGCIDFPGAYRAISWKSLVLIVGMMPFSVALQRTGGVDLAADALLAVVGNASPRLVLAALFAITAMLGLFISNTATAVLMAPVALALAKDLGMSAHPFAMIVALGASTAFMTPVSSPVNTLVVAPGNYAFGDFVKVGVPLSLAVLVVSVLLVPVLLPLR